MWKAIPEDTNKRIRILDPIWDPSFGGSYGLFWQLGTYPTPGLAWFYKSWFLESKLPQGAREALPKSAGRSPPPFGRVSRAPWGNLDAQNQDLENHARPGVGYVTSCLPFWSPMVRFWALGRRWERVKALSPSPCGMGWCRPLGHADDVPYRRPCELGT